MNKTPYDVNIGLEIHARLKTRSKLFCRCENRFDAEPNTLTCPICLGLPGALPVLNKKAIEFAIKLGLACNCSISEITHFDRKNYFYPDLPKGFQITQYENPICRNGFLVVSGRKIKIQQIHLEEDAGKSIHTNRVTLLDFNRCGVPLLEIVTEPRFSNPDEVIEFLLHLKRLLQYLDISDGNMEEGSLRCDANISLKPKSFSEMGEKVEVKNMNSFKSVKKALEYEIVRQTLLLNEHRNINQETRYWSQEQRRTFLMRRKEDTPDYRYFPEPDLPALKIDTELIDACRSEMPESPDDRFRRFRSEYGLTSENAELLTRDKLIADYFEAVNSHVEDSDLVCRWIVNEVFRILKHNTRDILSNKLNARRLAEFICQVKTKNISPNQAKSVFDQLLSDRQVKSILSDVESKNKTDQISMVLDKIINDNSREWRRLIQGEKKLLNFFIGRVIRKLPGYIDPVQVRSELSRRVDKEKS